MRDVLPVSWDWPRSLTTTRSLSDQTPGTAEQGPWRFTLEFPSYGPFLQHSRRRDSARRCTGPLSAGPRRDRWITRALIQKILSLRAEKAALLGFRTFAELSLAKKMAPSVAAVEEMFETLRRTSLPAAQKELAEIRALAAEAGVNEPLMNWDVAFWSERLREKKFQYTEEELRPYFPLESVLEGLFSLAQRLFGIRVTPGRRRGPGVAERRAVLSRF